MGGGGVGQGRGSGLGGLEAGGMGEVMCRWREGASSPSPPAVGFGGHPQSHQAWFPGTVGLPPAVCPSSLCGFFIPRSSPLFCLLFYVEMPALRTGLFWGGEPSSPRVGRVLAGKATPSGGARGPLPSCHWGRRGRGPLGGTCGSPCPGCVLSQGVVFRVSFSHLQSSCTTNVA